MAVHPSAKKFSGTAGALVNYYEEESDHSLAQTLGYYGIARDGIVFDRVAGKAAAHLPGLNLELGLTRAQHADIHNGRWGGQALVRQKGNYRFIWERDEKGHIVKMKDPRTGRMVNKPKMVPVVDTDGIPLLHELTGQPLMKRETESTSVAGYDLTFSLDKSWAEFLVAYPEHAELVKANFLKAINTAMQVAVEDHCKVIVKTTDGVKSRHTGNLLWFTVFGGAARPTALSIERGYEVDPSIHGHVFLSSVAWAGDKWRKIDGRAMFQSAEFRGAVCSVTFNRLMEDSGVKISYSEPDRKGRIHSEIEGSNVDVRKFFSTNDQRKPR